MLMTRVRFAALVVALSATPALAQVADPVPDIGKQSSAVVPKTSRSIARI